MDTSASLTTHSARRSPALVAVKWLVLTVVLVAVLATPTLILSLVG
jgi:hypothetical protein